jgi:hypothetical protein
MELFQASDRLSVREGTQSPSLIVCLDGNVFAAKRNPLRFGATSWNGTIVRLANNVVGGEIVVSALLSNVMNAEYVNNTFTFIVQLPLPSVALTLALNTFSYPSTVIPTFGLPSSGIRQAFCNFVNPQEPTVDASSASFYQAGVTVVPNCTRKANLGLLRGVTIPPNARTCADFIFNGTTADAETPPLLQSDRSVRRAALRWSNVRRQSRTLLDLNARALHDVHTGFHTLRLENSFPDGS